MPLTTDKGWADLVKTVKANNPSWGAKRIAREVRTEGERRGLSNPPHERTVGRILRRDWDTLTERQQAEFRYFSWPESMVRGDLSWEASATAFELLQVSGPDDVAPFIEDGPFKAPLPPHFLEHPDVRLAKWFWRVTQVIPHPPEGITPFHYHHLRAVLAHFLREWEIGGRSDDELARAVEAAIVTLRQELFNLDDMGAFWRIFDPWTLKEEDQHG